ncbi:hypothetical protein M153_14700018107, partial [Pseudoloma neurophilia]
MEYFYQKETQKWIEKLEFPDLKSDYILDTYLTEWKISKNEKFVSRIKLLEPNNPLTEVSKIIEIGHSEIFHQLLPYQKFTLNLVS